jgi:hypothetical protein
MSRLRNRRRLVVACFAALGMLAAVLTAAALTVGSSGTSASKGFVGWAFKEEAQAKAGEANEAMGESPVTAEEEAAALRAYPATEIPWAATQAAQAAWASISARGVGSGKNVPGAWTSVGPSTARFPGVLTFSGQEYVTSGRITSLAISPTCAPGNCRVWLGAAGGGIWRTDNPLAGNPKWDFVSAGLASNAIGSLELDPNDSSGNTIYAGTGEANASGDSEAGMGLYKSTDGGSTWTHLSSTVTALATAGNGTYTGDAFAGRSIGSVAIDPTNGNLYVGTTRGVRGVTSVTGGATSNPPTPRPPFGLFKSTDGGATFSFIWDGNASIRGVRRVAVDPLNHNRIYASAYQQGIWRSTGGGAFEQVFAPTSPAENTDRTEFALTVKNGKVRIYAGDGSTGAPESSFWRVDDSGVAAASLTSGGTNTGWTYLTSNSTASPLYGTYNYCTGQCWYDQYVVTPKGHPDIVYLGGSYQYGELGARSNGRAIVLSSDAGQHWNDMTWDASSSTPAGLHPDNHALVVNPSDPYQFFSASDGGIVRSSGSFKDNSATCDGRPLGAQSMAFCKQFLSAVPSNLTSLNTGLSTLQFQSLSVDPRKATHVQGGTQDNGTFETDGSFVIWPQTIYGDGGQSGFDATDPSFRFNTFFGQYTDANFRNGNPTKWVVISGPLFAESSLFYKPIIADPVEHGWIFVGETSVWRTKDGGGDPAYLEANCPEFTTDGANPACGDFVKLGASTLTSSGLGDRSGGNVAAVERARSDSSTLWAATTTGRVFISKNVGAEPASAVAFTRLDSLASVDPGRFVSGISIDPANANHAWISYSGYNFNTPGLNGHVFEVTYNPGAGTATWVDRSYNLADLPATDIARDDVTGDLYASSDFGVARLAFGTSTWVVGGTGLPMVEVAGLTIVPQSRILYAATHGRSAWRLNLP